MPWTVYRWLPGDTANPDNGGDSGAAASSVARFVREVREIDATGLRFVGNWRGGRLADHDRAVHEALSRSRSLIDTIAVEQLWDRLCDTPRIDEPDRWTHGDLMPGNLLVQAGELTAVIDVGGLAVRDPAVDLAPAWNLFSRSTRRVFRSELQVAEHTWDRGRGWSLVQAIGALHYYVDTNPAMATTAKHTLEALINDTGD
jgi:aminoglycoside phosphotransferase (APT) family kinase protein